MTPPVDPQRLRNIGIVAHINAGKTTLTEHILYDAGKQRWLGDVESGTATMDWMVEEQRRGISITAAGTRVEWAGHVIQLIDTPGHVDFTAEVERCVRVLDGIVVLLDGIRGVESQTEAVWRHAAERGLPCLVFVNKLDRASANFDRSTESAREVFGCRTVDLVRPLRDGERLVGLYDVVHRVAWPEAAAAHVPAEAAEAWHQAVVDVCSEIDESIVADFVEGREIAPDRLHAALRVAVCARRVMPVFAGAALEDQGVAALLDGVCRYLPSPLEAADAEAAAEGGFAGLLYKVHALDGDFLGFVRIFGGGLAVGDEVELASTGARVAIEAIYRMHSREREAVAEAGLGEFVAIPLPQDDLGAIRTGETLRAPGSSVVLAEVSFSEPVLTMSLEPRRSEGRDELEEVARRMALEDPTLTVRRDPFSGQLQVSGMGELHLEVFGSRLDRRLSEPARFGKPSVARYETVAGSASEEAEVARRLGDHEFAARVRVRVESGGDDPAVVVEDGSGHPAAAGVVEEVAVLARSGVLEPIPMRAVRIRVEELELRGEGEPAQIAAGDAAEAALRRAVSAAGRQTLEPLVRIVVDGPTESFSAVLADLRSRGATIGSVVPSFGSTRVEGEVRLAALLGYAGALRSKTQGKGSLRFELAGFVPAPPDGGEGDRKTPH